MLKERIFVLLALISLALISYRDCFDIFIPSDNFSELFFYAKHGAVGVIQQLEDGVLYIFSTYGMYLLYGLFDINAYCWIGFSVFLHAGVAYLIFLITNELIRPVFDNPNKYPGIFSSLLFLLSPYQTEAVIWNPTCLPVLFSAFWSLLSVYYAIKYFISQKYIFLFLLYISFLFAVVSLESSFFLPFACLALYVYLRIAGVSALPISAIALKIFLPLSCVMCFYFLTCRIFFGQWILHGGGPLDLKTDIIYLSENLLKYFAKFFSMYRYWNFSSWEGWIQKNHVNPLVAGALLILSASIFFFAIARFKKIKKESAYLLLTLFLCFLFSLVPVLPLDTSFLRIIYSDRYGYLPSAFFYMFIAIGVFLLFRRSVFIVLPVLAIIFWMLLNNTITIWKETNKYCYALLKNFEPYMDQGKIYILNLPGYYSGIAAFRTGFLESIYFKYGKDIPEINTTIVSHSYMDTSIDSVSVIRKNHNQFEVSVPKREKPYFGSGGGWAQSYSKNDFRVDYDPSKCSYLLSFRDSIPKDAIILRISGNRWEKIE